MNDREMELRERKLREDNQIYQITLRMKAGKFRALLEMAKLSGKESLIFINNPSQLRCEYCPICKCQINVKEGGVLCTGYFFSWLFETKIIN